MQITEILTTFLNKLKTKNDNNALKCVNLKYGIMKYEIVKILIININYNANLHRKKYLIFYLQKIC